MDGVGGGIPQAAYQTLLCTTAARTNRALLLLLHSFKVKCVDWGPHRRRRRKKNSGLSEETSQTFYFFAGSLLLVPNLPTLYT